MVVSELNPQVHFFCRGSEDSPVRAIDKLSKWALLLFGGPRDSSFFDIFLFVP